MGENATVPGGPDDPAVQAAAARAVELIADGAKVGLGSGRASLAFIAALGRAVRGGLRVVGVATSGSAAQQAQASGVPLVELGDQELDLTVDGADEVAPNLDLIKGRGGALVRERVVAAASRRQVILIGSDKLVGALGERGDIPVEIIPMALGLVIRRLQALGVRATLRQLSGGAAPFRSDNGNLIVDCALATPLADGRAARAMELGMRQLPGVVDTGLFLGTAERVLVGYPAGRVDVLVRPASDDPQRFP